MTENLPNINLKQKDKIAMGVMAALVLAIIAVPVLTWFAAVTALMATIAANSVYILVTVGGILLVLSTLWENRYNILYKWKLMARNVARSIAREDPIGVMDVAIKRFENKLEDIGQHLINAQAARKQQQESIDKLKHKAIENDGQAEAARRNGRSDREIAVFAMAATRSMESAAKLQPMADKFADICEKLVQARDVCRASLANMKDQRETFKIEYDTMMAGSKAIKGFKAFFGSNPDLDMLQLSIEQVDEQTAVAEAEIDQFLHDLQPQVDAQNLKQQAAEIAAVERIKSAAAIRALPAGQSVLNLPKVKDAVLVSKE